jgi:hypothetical protein
MANQSANEQRWFRASHFLDVCALRRRQPVVELEDFVEAVRLQTGGVLSRYAHPPYLLGGAGATAFNGEFFKTRGLRFRAPRVASPFDEMQQSTSGRGIQGYAPFEGTGFWAAAALHLAYRHAALPPRAVVVRARLRTQPGDASPRMAEIRAAREATQPIRARTGGSTFRNPEGQKAWALIDAAGCRGMRLGAAQVSEKHCNFLLNLGGATAADIEGLGEAVRARVRAHCGVDLHWEIARLGVAA